MNDGKPDPIAEIRRLYFAATAATILDDFDRAIDLLKSIESSSDRERAAVYMEGLAELRREFKPKAAPARKKPGAGPRRR